MKTLTFLFMLFVMVSCGNNPGTPVDGGPVIYPAATTIDSSYLHVRELGFNPPVHYDTFIKRINETTIHLYQVDQLNKEYYIVEGTYTLTPSAYDNVSYLDFTPTSDPCGFGNFVEIVNVIHEDAIHIDGELYLKIDDTNPNLDFSTYTETCWE